MKSTTRGLLARAAVAAFALAAAAPPVAALAEESESAVGADILIPKPAEFIPALIAFLVIWFILAKFAWPQVTEMMERRQQKIQGDLDAAAAERAKAEEERREYQAQIAGARREADEIIASAKREAEEERSRILAKAQADAAATVAKAHDAVSSERHKAMIELSGQVVDLSVEIASKIIGNDLSEDAQRRLAAKYLAEVSAGHEKHA